MNSPDIQEAARRAASLILEVTGGLPPKTRADFRALCAAFDVEDADTEWFSSDPLWTLYAIVGSMMANDPGGRFRGLPGAACDTEMLEFFTGGPLYTTETRSDGYALALQHQVAVKTVDLLRHEGLGVFKVVNAA